MPIELLSEDSGLSNQKIRKYWKQVLSGAVLILGLTIISFSYFISDKEDDHPAVCPLVEIYRPSTYEANKPVLQMILHDAEFRNHSASLLQQAIEHRTDIFDDYPLNVTEDPELWEKFSKFQDFLKDSFPLFHDKTKLHKVNEYGLVYIWKGTDLNLKPLLLMAHQDTVPATELTLPQWETDPFQGVYDGVYMYGRGVADCKNLLIGHLETAELLIENGFSPRRTIIYSFGFDEEVGGIRNKNAQFLEELYGRDSMYAVCDEGGVSLIEIEDLTLAIPGTSEKGYLDVEITLESAGGHSSVPPKHTSIGMMSDLIMEIENDEFPTYFTEANPAFFQYMCLAENSIDIDESLKNAILKSGNDGKANRKVRDYINSNLKNSYVIKTTQAVDIISGGSKANALPEFVSVLINSRIAVEENYTMVMNKFVQNAKVIAKRYNIGISVKYETDGDYEVVVSADDKLGILKLTNVQSLNPAPLTPTNDKHWEVFAGSIRHLYEELALPERFSENKLIVSPGMGSGNTDTKYNWNLSKNIYRYRPGEITAIESKAHGVNEYIKFDSHLQIIAFFYEYIHAVDELDDV